MTKEIVAVIGNGESRSILDIFKILELYHTIGCNAIHRQYQPDEIVCCDRDMAMEVVDNPKTEKSKIHVRGELYEHLIKKHHNVRAFPELPFPPRQRSDQPENWGSGSYAVFLSALDHRNDVYLLGFDLYSANGLINNVYKGTKNYRSKDSKSVDPGYWIYQIAKIFKSFKQKNFVIFNKKDWHCPTEWQFPNVHIEDIENFKKVLNTN